MNISYRWLRDLVTGLTGTPQQIADRLAMIGAPVDEIVDIGGPLKAVIIGRVLEARRHPNADRLSLCTVESGTGHTLQVVCGAPNVKAGAYYPFAPVGAELPGGVTIRKAKIRGEESQGMLCSARELGLGRDHEGILELHGEFEPGRSFIESLGLDDTRLVVDVTPNRPDLLSHIGIARELAAAQELSLALHDLPGTPPLPPLELGAASVTGVHITLDDSGLCPRYLGAVMRGVRIAPSPEWLASRLRAIGQRPINNVVDATNYVLHELGQPLHAFDLDRIGERVIVRRARAGERITTLDGTDRTLSPDMLVIAGADKAAAIAGVMGGADTEVHPDTTNILLECALFDARSVRATRRALGLSTDASYRFERGVDPDSMARALQRACEIIVAVAGGTLQPQAAAAGAGLSAAPKLTLRLARAHQILGEPFVCEQAMRYLRSLGFGVAGDGMDVLHVEVPGHRRYDVSREEDLVEELARRHGYDAFPDTLRPFRPSVVPTHPLFLLEDQLRALLTGRGFNEARTAAFAPEAEGDVALLLPLAATESRLRRALLPGLLHRVAYNFARGARSIRLFEIGTAFSRSPDGPPHERTRCAIVCTGLRRPPHWSEGEATFDVWDIKALAAELAAVLGLELAAAPDATGDGVPAGAELFDPAQSFRLSLPGSGTAVGEVGRMRAGTVDAPAWADDVWGLELELLDGMTARAPIRYVELAQFPAIERDLALLVSAGVPAASVTEAIRAAAGVLLESAWPFDVYSGKGVPAGMRSIACRLRFRAADRTLTDAEVDDSIRRVLVRLNDDLGVRQRA
ncbi:MAG TPA: phenylalanine--tRNA ligase subunit beta [Longimicrobiales bacterium]|nr:phenylalanine--tRNA ligase subunit beta [Longimicrobiales bacterium]